EGCRAPAGGRAGRSDPRRGRAPVFSVRLHRRPARTPARGHPARRAGTASPPCGRGLLREPLPQVATGVGVAREQVGDRPGELHAPAVVPALGSEVDDVVGAGDDVQVVPPHLRRVLAGGRSASGEIVPPCRGRAGPGTTSTRAHDLGRGGLAAWAARGAATMGAWVWTRRSRWWVSVRLGRARRGSSPRGAPTSSGSSSTSP